MSKEPASESSHVHLVRDVLDMALKDRAGQHLGRADRIVLSMRDDAPPEVAWIETGGAAMAARLSVRLGRGVHRFGRRFGLHAGRPARFRWVSIMSIGAEIRLDVEKNRTPASLWERWLVQHVVRWIPGIKKA